MTLETRGFSRVAAGFSSYEGDFWLPLVLAQGSPIFYSSCEGELGVVPLVIATLTAAAMDTFPEY